MVAQVTIKPLSYVSPLCNDLDPEDASKIVERFVPEHAGLLLTAIDQPYPDVPSL